MSRDLLSTGIKVLGVYLIVLGLLTCGRNLLLAGSWHMKLRDIKVPWVSDNVPADLRADIMNQNRMSRDVQRHNLATQRTTALHTALWALFQVLAGWSVARYDRQVVRILGIAPEPRGGAGP